MPEVQPIVGEFPVIHYMAADPQGDVVTKGTASADLARLGASAKGGRFRVACGTKKPLGHLNLASGDTLAVNCPACMGTEVFKKNHHPPPEKQKRVLPESCC